jgi:hypothetical protein
MELGEAYITLKRNKIQEKRQKLEVVFLIIKPFFIDYNLFL